MSSYFSDFSKSGTGYSGTIEDPFSYEDFVSSYNSVGSSYYYFIKGKATVSSSSTALTGSSPICAWDLEEFGPWRLEITDISKFISSGEIYDGIIILNQTGDIALGGSSYQDYYNVNFYRQTTSASDKLTLGSASGRCNFFSSTFQVDGILEIIRGSLNETCVYVENGITIPSSASSAAISRCTYNYDTTAITPDPGFSGWFNLFNNQDFFSFTLLSDIDDNPELPTGITVSSSTFKTKFHFDGELKPISVGAFYSRSGANTEVYVDLDSGTSTGTGTELSPYNSTQFYASFTSFSVGTKVKIRGFDDSSGSIALVANESVSLEKWGSLPWGVKRDGSISFQSTKISGAIIRTEDDFILSTYGINDCYINANRIVFSSSYPRNYSDTFFYYIVKGSTIISSGVPSRIGSCSTFEVINIVDSYVKDVGPSDIGTVVYLYYNAINSVFSYVSNSIAGFFDITGSPGANELNVYDSAFNVNVSDVTFSTTYTENDYLYPSEIYTVLNDTSSLYANKTGYSSGLSGNSRYGMGAYYFPPISASFTGAPTSGSAPLSVSFTEASTGIILSYAWDFGDTNTDTAQNPVNVYSSSGTYTVTLTITGPDGTSDTLILTDYITVGSVSLLAAFSGTPRVGTTPHQVVFTDSSTGGIITARTWVFGDGTTLTGNDTSVIYTYESAGIYTVQLTVTDGVTSDIESKVNYIAVNPDIAEPNLIMAKSDSKGEGRYWNFYLDQEGHLVFENERVTYRSVDKIININNWTFVQFNPGSNKMYVGDPNNFIREINMITTSTCSPESPTKKRLYSALNSSFVIDELKIWYGEQDLTSYFASLWGKADGLSD